MDYLKEVKTMDEVHSKDFNQILIKTPPRLYSIGIVVFFICTLAIVIIGLLFKYEKSIELDFASTISPTSNEIVLVVITNKEIDYLLKNKEIIIEKSSDNKLSASNKKLKTNFQSYTKEQLVSDDKSLEQLSNKNFDKILLNNQLEYINRYEFLISSNNFEQPFSKYDKGKIYFRVGEEPLYKMFF
ncbi:MAG: hypothetical protein MK226_20715 [Saprospiraceae bacterium]|nr:hypothetical protein [Saprospiraceae bacterium]